MAIGQSFNLQEKDIDDNLKIIINKTVKAYNTSDRIYKIDEEDIVIPKIGYFKGIKVY